MRSLFMAAIFALPAFSGQPQFEVASIKPTAVGNENGAILFRPGGRFTATAIPLKTLVSTAYKVRLFYIYGGPDWISSDTWDIVAKADSSAKRDQVEVMLQSLIEDRFRLKAHRETRELPVYALETAKNGPKLRETADSECVVFRAESPRPSANTPYCGWFSGSRNSIRAVKVDMSHLADALSVQPPLEGRPVLDKTGLTGTYNVDLQWAPVDSDAAASGPSIFTALQEQLGLKLESQKAPVEVFVIDHVERPTTN